MSNEFKKEDRYLVIKRSDLDKYCTLVNPYAKAVLTPAIDGIAECRAESGKSPLECVVVESDWPIYNDVWKMVEAIANNQPTELEQLRKERDEAVEIIEAALRIKDLWTYHGEVLQERQDEGTALSTMASNFEQFLAKINKPTQGAWVTFNGKSHPIVIDDNYHYNFDEKTKTLTVAHKDRAPEFFCKKCDGFIEYNTAVTLTSCPPKYSGSCKDCGHTAYIECSKLNKQSGE